MSKIGLMASTGAAAGDWRVAARIPIEHSPWLQTPEDVRGISLYSIILVPGWTQRAGNVGLYQLALTRLTRRGADALIVAEAAIVDAEDGRLAVMPPPGEEPLLDRHARRMAEHAEAAFPMTPTVERGSERELCLRVISHTLYGMMDEEQRRILADHVRRDRPNVAMAYANAVAQALGVRADVAIDSETARREIIIGMIVMTVGPRHVQDLRGVSTSRLETLRSLCDAYQMAQRMNHRSEMENFDEAIRVRLGRMIQEVRPPAPPSMPPIRRVSAEQNDVWPPAPADSVPIPPPRPAVVRRPPVLPFADNFRDISRRERVRIAREAEDRRALERTRLRRAMDPNYDPNDE